MTTLMSRTRGSLSAGLLLAGTAAATTWISTYAWSGFVEEPGGFLNPLMLLAIFVAGTGALTRWWRMPAALGVLVQVLVCGMLASLLLTGSPLPLGGAWTELHADVSAAFDSASRYAAPVPADAPPVDPLLILCGLLCLLLVDLLACTLHRAPLAGIPLLTIYSIPVSMVGDPIAWWVFAVTAAGYLMLLFLQMSDQVNRWGRPLGEDRETGDPISYGVGNHSVRSTATTIGGVATALAIFLPALIPTAGLHVFDFGPGSGGGNDIRIDNPVTDLVRDLKRGDDTPLLRVTTTDPDPSYLRILALTRFTDAEWSPGNRDVPADQLADGQLPPPQGVAAEIGRREYPYDLAVLPAFDSRWLPTQPPVSRIQAPGDWRYDTKTMDFLAGEDGLSTSGLHYTMSAVELDLTSARLADTGTSNGEVSKSFLDVPSDLPPVVRDLATEVTRNAATRYEKAVALQDWFRVDGGFTYSLATAPGSGTDALVDFLSDGPGGRTGYCEQFASAMAVMARMLGIPARVAVGFLSPSPAGPDTWVYSSDDMHAWPELYFDGAGWVRFEPTPAGRVGEVPSYTVPGSTVQPGRSNVPVPRTSDAAPTRSQRPSESSTDAAAAADRGDTGPGLPWAALVGTAAGVLVVLAGLMLPRLVRHNRRGRRLAAGGPEEVWAELRDTAVDLGVPWAPGRSPRATRDELVHHLGAPVDSTTPDRPAHGSAVAPEGVAALDRIVLAVELHRYARSDVPPDRDALRADAHACLAALAGGATRGARRRAAWWPRSVLSGTTRRPRPVATTVEARYGGMVDHVG